MLLKRLIISLLIGKKGKYKQKYPEEGPET